MAKTKHKQKLKLARRLREILANNTLAFFLKQGRTFEDAREMYRDCMRQPVFTLQIWEMHKQKIANRVDRTIVNQQMMKSKRIFKLTGKIV